MVYEDNCDEEEDSDGNMDGFQRYSLRSFSFVGLGFLLFSPS